MRRCCFEDQKVLVDWITRLTGMGHPDMHLVAKWQKKSGRNMLQKSTTIPCSVFHTHTSVKHVYRYFSNAIPISKQH